MPATPRPKDRLFVALDVKTVDDARRLVERSATAVSYYKIGLELVFGGGLEFALGLKAAGRQVFLDMKLLDIGNTVEKAHRNIAPPRPRTTSPCMATTARRSTRRSGAWRRS